MGANRLRRGRHATQDRGRHRLGAVLYVGRTSERQNEAVHCKLAIAMTAS